MKGLLLFFLALIVLPWKAHSEHVSTHTGQFVVSGQASVLPTPVQVATNRAAYVYLEPHFLAVMAERVKQALLQELKQPDAYRDKIYLQLLGAAPPERPVAILSRGFTDGWQYHVSIPAIIEQEKLLKCLVQVLLMEFANRGHRRSAEIPMWLLEGMNQEIMSASLPTFLVSRRVLSMEVLGYDRIHATRELLRTNIALTVHDLSFPRLDFQDRNQAALYRASAHMFTHELLRLPNGPRLLAQFIQTLPTTLNWQTAFFQVYQRYFPKMLDLEKWWALASVDVRSREGQLTWPLETSIQKLQSLLLTSLEIRSATNSLPVRREVTLQELITATEYAMQKEVLVQKIRDLAFLSLNLAPPVQPLANRYRAALQEYLDGREAGKVQPALRQDPEKRTQLWIRDTVQNLTALDQQVLQVARGDSKTSVLRKANDRR
jgi:hypothetical protein